MEYKASMTGTKSQTQHPGSRRQNSPRHLTQKTKSKEPMNEEECLVSFVPEGWSEEMCRYCSVNLYFDWQRSLLPVGAATRLAPSN